MGYRVTTNEIMDFLRQHMVTKDYLEERLKDFATKDDIKGFVTRAELREDLERYATKDDIMEMKSDIFSLVDGFAKRYDTVSVEVAALHARVTRIEQKTGLAEG